MKLHLNQDQDLLLIRSYSADQITLGDQQYRSSVMVMLDRIIDDWRPSVLAELTEQDFRLMVDMKPEVVLLGTGRSMRFPPRSVTRPLIDRSIGLEVMDTSAACRTYNVLAAEGRNVLAALIIESSG